MTAQPNPRPNYSRQKFLKLHYLKNEYRKNSKMAARGRKQKASLL
jgi:hypothetical protein